MTTRLGLFGFATVGGTIADKEAPVSVASSGGGMSLGLGLGITMLRAGSASAALFSHTFTAADSALAIPAADTGQATQVLAGTWGIASNRAYLATSSGGNNNAVVWNVGVSDLTWSVTAAVFDAAGNGPRLIFRATDVDNLFMVACDTSTSYLYRREAGAYTLLGSGAAAWVTGDELSAVLNGTGISVRRNGVEVVAATSSFNQTATRHGFGQEGTGTTRFDNLTGSA
jgi:hypothetical protein